MGRRASKCNTDQDFVSTQHALFFSMRETSAPRQSHTLGQHPQPCCTQNHILACPNMPAHSLARAHMLTRTCIVLLFVFTYSLHHSMDARAKAKREADARAKLEREAAARAKAKREADARAKAKREADAKAKLEREAAAAAALVVRIESILDVGLAATASKDAAAKLAELHNLPLDHAQKARQTELQTLSKQLVLQEMVAATAALDIIALDAAISDAQPDKIGLPAPLDQSPVYAQAIQAHHQAFEKYVVSKCKLLYLTDNTIITVWEAVNTLGAVGPSDLSYLTEASLVAQGVLPLQAAKVVQAFASDAGSSSHRGPYPAQQAAALTTGAPIPRSERSMHHDQANPPTAFTHDEWMGLKDALFAAGGTMKALAKTMNIAQHYYSELMNMVGNKGRILAEIAAAYFYGSNASSGGRGGGGRGGGRGGGSRGRGGGGGPHVSLNDRITAMDVMLASGTFPPGRHFSAAIVRHLRTLQTVGNKASHPGGIAPTDRPALVHAMYAVAVIFRPAATAAGGAGGGGGGLIVQVQAIRAALNIATPATQILNVVNEAHAMLGLPAWGPASDGTLPGQVAAVCAMLGV